MATRPFSIGSRIWPGISKLIEEMGEVGQICGKLIGTGGDRHHWDGEGDLQTRLVAELGDLLAAIEFVSSHNQLDRQAIAQRYAHKLALFTSWHQEQADE